jgi:hypothetical protein
MAKTWHSMKAAADYNKGRHAVRGDRMSMGRFASYAPSSDLSCPLGRANGRGKKSYTFKHEKTQRDVAVVDFLERMQAEMWKMGRN